jgi:ATP-dependent helicase YprA (DUF1998 family)
MMEPRQTNLTPDGLQTYLRDAFMRYYNTAYELRDRRVSEERERLIRTPGTAFSEPFIEVMTSYPVSDLTLSEILADLSVDEAAALIAAGLLPFERPYRHQAEALVESFKGHDVIVGTGTGSGKTEAFLLPIVTSLVKESRSWAPPPEQQATDWWRGNTPFTPQRAGLDGRPVGIRALLLYPMNALVEDQMVRLRAALDSPDARSWFEDHRPGHRFYFGRYTGRTPVPGTREAASVDRVKRLRELLRGAAARQRQLVSRVTAGDLPEMARYFLPALDGAEMLIGCELVMDFVYFVL